MQLEDSVRVEAAVQALLARSGASEAKATGLRNIANTFAWKQLAYSARPAQEQEKLAFCNKYLVAIANHLLANYPGTDAAMWAERDLAIVALQSDGDAAAEAAIGRLMDQKDPAAALHFLGDYYAQMKRDDKAGTLYQHVADKYPNHEVVPLAKVGLAQIKIRQGDDAAAEAIFAQILTDYANHPRLAETIHLMAEGYYEHALAEWRAARPKTGSLDETSAATTPLPEPVVQYFHKAIAKWAIVIDQLPPTPNARPTACLYSAICHSYLGACDKAIPLFQDVAYSYPEAPNADYAALMVARRLDRLMRARGFSSDEADAKARPIYEQVIQCYPSSPYARIARHELEQIDSRTRAKGE